MLKRSAALLLPFALAACAPSMMAPNASNVDGLYLQAVTGSNLFEIQSSQVALQKSNTPAVRAYAQQMINEHTVAQNQVAALAAARRVPLPPALPPELQLKVNTLSGLSGAAFDAAYLREQAVSHLFTVTIFQNELTGGKDAQVVAFANQNLPLIQRHLQEAVALGGSTSPAGQ
ncbi:hypothetical protein DAETH_05170 [Deinococcus aetherius]|uniref:DUF4142 domain-containing protein n=1 Tax=Deinococcus aetherius TaxID=200252 RepID=A0ABN6RD49_9DEIO|nr:DUF4142 domain-containing protein [Deinococcus aetherius]BDP40548.1 hypothetical protein DAETH_05170 [Deinococcus aetherius]